MDRDEQQSKPTNEFVKFILNSKTFLTSSTKSNPIQVEKVYMYEAETQTISTNEQTDNLSKEAGDEARLTGSNKYALLSLDEYQITRTGEEHCLKKYFSDDDISLSDDEINVEKQIEQINLDEKGDGTVVLIENVNNNNASTILRPSQSNLSNTLILDDTTHLSATLAQSTSSRISHSRFMQATFKEDEEEINDDELDQFVASTFSPIIENDDKNLSSIRWFVRQAIDSCRQNLTLVDQLLETIPSTPSYEHILQRKIHRTNCILNIPNAIKGLQYYPSASVQTE